MESPSERGSGRCGSFRSLHYSLSLAGQSSLVMESLPRASCHCRARHGRAGSKRRGLLAGRAVDDTAVVLLRVVRMRLVQSGYLSLLLLVQISCFRSIGGSVSHARIQQRAFLRLE